MAKIHKPYRYYIYTCTHKFWTTKPQAFTCLSNDLPFWLFSCPGMGGMCLFYLGCWYFFPTSLSWECLEMVVAENLKDSVSPHPHWFRMWHSYCGQPYKSVGEGPHGFFFFSFLSPFIFCGQRLQPTIVLVVPNSAFSKHGLMEPLTSNRQIKRSFVQPRKLSHWQNLAWKIYASFFAPSSFPQSGSENTRYLLSTDTFLLCHAWVIAAE